MKIKKCFIIGIISFCVIAIGSYIYSWQKDEQERARLQHDLWSIEAIVPNTYVDLYYYLNGDYPCGTQTKPFRDTKQFKDNWPDYRLDLIHCEINNMPPESTTLYRDIKAYETLKVLESHR